MMERQQFTAHVQQDLLPTTALPNDLVGWLIANSAGCTYMLAHAEDGLIWGRCDGQKLITSHDVFPHKCKARLRAATLWHCRLFGLDAEVALWKDYRGWHGQRVSDLPDSTAVAFEEEQMLWGNEVIQSASQQQFSLMRDGAEGLLHGFPHAVASSTLAERPLRLVVRHYIDYDQSGLAQISLSRLVDLRVLP